MKESEASFVSEEEYKLLEEYIPMLDAFARTTYSSIYVIDFFRKNFLYVSDNPLFLCGLSADEVKEMGYEFYIHHVIDEDLHLLKHMDSTLHQLYCGVPNELILSNLKMIAEAGKDFFIRIPLIEGVNADEENILRTATFLSGLPWKQKMVNLLLYHDIGKSKHDKLETVYNPAHLPMSTPSPEVQQRCIDLFRQYGIDAVIGG